MGCAAYNRPTPTGSVRSWQDEYEYREKTGAAASSTFFWEGTLLLSVAYTEGDDTAYSLLQEVPVAGFQVSVAYTEEADTAHSDVLFFGAWIDFMAHFWKLDEEGTHLLVDSAGDNDKARVINDGLNNETSVYVDEEFGRARDFSKGVSTQYSPGASHIKFWDDIADATHQVASWTLSFRIKIPPAVSFNFQDLWTMGRSDHTNNVVTSYANSSSQDFSIEVRGRSSGLYSYWSASYMSYRSPEIYDDAWHRVTITYSADKAEVRAYVGKEILRHNTTGEPVIGSGIVGAYLEPKVDRCGFGGTVSQESQWSNDSNLSAIIDELAIFNRPLSESEIQSDAYQDQSLAVVPVFGERPSEVGGDDLLNLVPQNPVTAPDSLSYVAIGMCSGSHPFYIAGYDAGLLKTVITPQEGYITPNSCPPIGRWSSSGRYYVSGDGPAAGSAGISIFDRLQLIANLTQIPVAAQPDDWFPLSFDTQGGASYVQDIGWSDTDEFFYTVYRTSPFFVVYKSEEDGMRTHFCPFHPSYPSAVGVQWAGWAPGKQACALLYSENSGALQLGVYDFSGMIGKVVALPAGLPAKPIQHVAWSGSGDRLSITYATTGDLADTYVLGSVCVLLFDGEALVLVQEIQNLHVTSDAAWSSDGKLCIPLSKGVGAGFTPVGSPVTPPYFRVYRESSGSFVAIQDPASFPNVGTKMADVAWSYTGRYLSVTNPLGTVSIYEYSNTDFVARLSIASQIETCLEVKWSPTRNEFLMDSFDYGVSAVNYTGLDGTRVWHMQVVGQGISDIHADSLPGRANQHRESIVQYGWSPCGNYSYIAQSPGAIETSLGDIPIPVFTPYYRNPVSGEVDIVRFPTDYYPVPQTQEVQWVSQSSLHEVDSMTGSLVSSPSAVPTSIYLFGNSQTVRSSWDPQKYVALVKESMGGQKIPMSSHLYSTLSASGASGIGAIRKIVTHPGLTYAVCIGDKESLAPSLFFLNLETGEQRASVDPSTMVPGIHSTPAVVHDVAFSHAGTRMAVCHGHSLRVYQTSNWSKIFEIDFNLDEAVTSASWNDDDSLLAFSVLSASIGTGVHLRNTADWTVNSSLTLPGTLSGVNYVSFSADGTKLIACHSSNGSGGTLWSVSTGAEHTIPVFDAGGVEGFWAAWSPDGGYLVIRTDSSPAYRVVELTGFTEVAVTSQYNNAAAGQYHGAFAWDADGTLLVVNPGVNVRRIVPLDWSYPSTVHTFGGVFDGNCVAPIPNSIVGRVVGTVKGGADTVVQRNLRLFQRYADLGSTYVTHTSSDINTGIFAFKVAFKDECIMVGKHDDAAEGTPRPDRAVRVFPR